MFDKTCVAIIMCLYNSVNLSGGRAVTNVGRTCGPTPLLVLLVIFSCNTICLYYTIKGYLFASSNILFV